MRISDWSSDVCSSDLLACLDPRGVAVIARRIMVVGERQARLFERLVKALFAFGGRTEAGGAAHDADAAMTESDQLAHRFRTHLAVVRRHAMPRIVEQSRADAAIAPAQALASRRESVIPHTREPGKR